MLITDPIADMIIRIKNALLAKKSEVTMPHSKIKAKIAEILLEHKYIEDYQVLEKKPQPEIVIKLRYLGKRAAITNVKRLSKPGVRLYSPAKQIPQSLGGYGITIVSTNKGVMTDAEAKKLNAGGELLCQIW
ncbi:MAG: 30S ribosomal protein S8 [Candidatus Woesebacteria bacterium]|jgi:small subunit ribosomal protein S8